ncbi:ABC transporter ATP-binding protein/permease [Streptomyces bauhiniae]|uniref:ABC transporter ATP-binding protein/permease n=1 Tax=Streptomyces bauhiniae TaxID=2340725 RepID=UPI0035D9EF28
MTTDTAALLTHLGQDEAERQRGATRRLADWATFGEPAFRRAGTLRGLAAIGHVIWASGLGWAAEAALHAQRSGVTPVVVLPGAVVLAAGPVLRAALLAAADRAADDGAAHVRRALRARILSATLPEQVPPVVSPVSDAAVSEALDGEVARLDGWLTSYVPARRAMLIGSGVVLVAIASRSWVVALILLLATPLLPVNLKVIGMGTRAAVRAQLTATRTLNTRLLDHLRGLPTLVTLGADEDAARSVEADDRELARRTQTVLRVAFLSTAWIELLVTVTMAVVATYCGLVLLGYLHVSLIPATMSLGTALFVLILTPVYFAPVRELARGYHARAEASAAAELIAEVMGSAAGTTAPSTAPPAPHPVTGGPVTGRAAGHRSAKDRPIGVRLTGVTVDYPDRDVPALDNVNLTVAPGSVLAVTGPSGAGKSTLLSVVAGLLIPSLGTAHHLAGPDQAPAAPTAVAWVGQPSYLIAGSLRDNLRLAKPGASDQELTDAFPALGFPALLAAFPRGLDTEVGERGAGLSSGQTQQLVLVRALLRDAPLLCLDEPTAHLDPAGEARVITAVRTLARTRTVLLTTHSPTLLGVADRVMRMERGRLTEAAP